MAGTFPLKNDNNDPTTPVHLPASHLSRPATPELAKRQKHLMIGWGIAYAIVVGVAVLLLVHWLLGSNAGFGASLGQVMGYGFSPVLLWAVGRVTGLMVGFQPRVQNPVDPEPGDDNNVGSRTAANADTTEAEEDPVVAVVDADEHGNHLALNNGNVDVPQPFYRIASKEETKQQNSLLLKYGLAFFPLGIAPLVVFVSWQGSFLPDAIGCLIGYVTGSLYYPVILMVVSCTTDQHLLWMHRQLVCIADDIVHQQQGKVNVLQGKQACDNV